MTDSADSVGWVDEVDAVRLADGRFIPRLGLGTYKMPADSTAELVETALRLGYRHVDTATLYRNERGVGDGIRRSGLPRDEVFVTTKVWDDAHGYDETLRAFDTSLVELQLDAVDLYLIHWPCPRQDRYVDTWRALVRLREEGRARSIGVSNFHPHHIDRLIAETGVAPVVDQVELHPRFPQTALREWAAGHGVVIESWAPLARGGLLDHPALRRIADRHGCTPAQVIIRWHLELGLVVIPKSALPERIRENLEVGDLVLDADDMAAIAALETSERTGMDPDDHG